jgi:hypothetical protein
MLTSSEGTDEKFYRVLTRKRDVRHDQRGTEWLLSRRACQRSDLSRIEICYKMR